MMTIGIDMEEFERIQRQMREEEAGRTISVEATETTKEDRKEPTSGTIETETQSEPSRLASAIIAAREAKPRSARKASTIESTGSRVRRRQAKKKANGGRKEPIDKDHQYSGRLWAFRESWRAN